MNSKITMTDMKRRASALLDFISRTQVDLAGETISAVDGTPDKASSESSTQKPEGHGVDQSKDFKGLNCMEMMDSLTRRLVKWQQEYST
jgi:hypothetical protein